MGIVKPGEDERGRGSPQARDLSVLPALARYRYLTTSQIEQLFFPSQRVTNRRMAVLSEHKLVRKFRKLAVPGHGSNEFIYYLSAAGARWVATRMGVESVTFPKARKETTESQSMEHVLGIIRMWLAIAQACKSGGIELVAFWPEWEGKHDGRRFVSLIADQTPDRYKERHSISFKPDAAFLLGRGGKRVLFFLEVDRGHESVRGFKRDAFSAKFTNYASYRESGGFKRYGKTLRGFRVLTTWLSERRMHHARAAAAELGLRQMFLFTPFEAVTPETVLKRSWYKPGEGGNTELDSPI